MPKPIVRKFTVIQHDKVKGIPAEVLGRILLGKRPHHKMGFGQKKPRGLRKHVRFQKAIAKRR